MMDGWIMNFVLYLKESVIHFAQGRSFNDLLSEMVLCKFNEIIFNHSIRFIRLY